MRSVIVSILCLSLPAVSEAAQPKDGWETIDTRTFSFMAPFSFRKLAPEGQLIDSIDAGDYLSEDGNIYLSYDFGAYSPDFTYWPKETRYEEVTINGLKGRIGIVAQPMRSGYHHAAQLHLLVYPNKGDKDGVMGVFLTVTADCLSEKEVDIARRMFKSIRLKKSQ